MSDLYRMKCDSVVHDDTDNSTPEPIVPQCHDWHPDLVWYEKVEPTDTLCTVHSGLKIASYNCVAKDLYRTDQECVLVDIVQVEASDV